MFSAFALIRASVQAPVSSGCAFGDFDGRLILLPSAIIQLIVGPPRREVRLRLALVTGCSAGVAWLRDAHALARGVALQLLVAGIFLGAGGRVGFASMSKPHRLRRRLN